MKKLLSIFLILVLLSSCANTNLPSYIKGPDKNGGYTMELFAMDTFMSFTAYGKTAPTALGEIREMVQSYDKAYSPSYKGNFIDRLNSVGEATLDEKDYALFEKCLEISRSTDGAFDITVSPLIKAWGFGEAPHVPDSLELFSLLEKVGYEKITLKDNHIYLRDNAEIIMGGILKGFCAGEAEKIFSKHDIKNAMINLGGNVLVRGENASGDKYQIGIQNPLFPNEAKHICLIKVSDTSVVTSGGYRRFFTENGKTYHHILNPKTGMPAESGLLSATVVTTDAIAADALSTALFVMGKEGAISYWKEKGGFEAVLITDNSEIIVTEGLKEAFTLAEDCDFSVVIAEK